MYLDTAAGSWSRARWLVFALGFFLAASIAGCGTEHDTTPATTSASTPPRDEPTGPPADDENDITPGDKTDEEKEVEQEPPPPPPPPPPPKADRLCFTPREDCVRVLLGFLRAENEGIDMPIYHLYDRRISDILIAKHRAGVRVRVIADRHAYTSKRQHAREMNYLAASGVPVRTGRFRGIVHTKTTILHGLGMVEMGSMNYTAIASRRVRNPETGLLEWNDEVAFFTTNPKVFARFAERFERMWANTGEGREAFLVFRQGMLLPNFAEAEAARPVTCYENPDPDPKPLPDDPEMSVCLAPDQDCDRDVVAPVIRKERGAVDVLMFRGTSSTVSVPLIAAVKAGRPVRVIFDRAQRENTRLYPSMARIINELWAANTAGNLQLKATAHPGYMHMKAIVTPGVALWGSGNYSVSSSTRVRGCQNTFYQHEDMIITRLAELIDDIQAHFDAMWASGEFETFVPEGAATPTPAPSPPATPSPAITPSPSATPSPAITPSPATSPTP